MWYQQDGLHGGLPLTSGMPELVVKKISGHSNNSRSFFRYVNFAQDIVDREIDKMHRNFE
jgi:hypothetical protein